ncbi:thiamine phosphate synthase [Alicyclobacillus dauci]|uniref:Thiamine-phosphate synthase n=1 Tax=Alicyclobacillus dauci TaxID=1475485 RepID=A0ABY6YZU4_9BACL|nr:thiamine phosphate synthase [Alicyclobacillus dauci]WAH36150.1 thiamine phosphate synthase [Alicyclobacillus dauci]
MSNLADSLRLYLVTDDRPDAESVIAVVRQAIMGGVTAVQLRRKTDDGGKFVELGRSLRKLTREFGVLFFVNDRVDVALLTDADGVHVGQSDISCKDARKLVGNKIIGVSAANVEEARKAEADGADYLGIGAIYQTSSKDDADMTSLAELRRISQATNVPLVAIGGITSERVPEVIGAGAHGVAVMSAIMSATDPKLAAGRLLTKL